MKEQGEINARILKEIKATNDPGDQEVDVAPLLHLVEDIISRAILNIQDNIGPATQAHLGNLKPMTHHASVAAILDEFSKVTDQISSKLMSESGGVDEFHQTTVSLFKMLSNFSWHSKLVLTLVSFAINNGEFWLLSHIYSSSKHQPPAPKSIAILKQLPIIMQNLAPREKLLDELTKLIEFILNVTKSIFEFKELSLSLRSVYNINTEDVPAFSAAKEYIPIAVYWVIRSVVDCSLQITRHLTKIGSLNERISSFDSTRQAQITADVSRLSKNNWFESTRGQLKEHLARCKEYIDGQKKIDPYRTLKRLFETFHVDNMKILKALIYAKDDLPLVVGTTKTKAKIDILRRKSVLLLISDLELSMEELIPLQEIYKESLQNRTRYDSQYEVVWLPITEQSDTMQKKFDNLQAKMPWHTVHDPSSIDPSVIRYIKEEWHFGDTPMLVVFDPQGRVVSLNALHMVWIWRLLAFSFTTSREEVLWKGEETWRLEFLVHDNIIDPVIINWIKEEKFICLYGSEDIEWIRNFTNKLRAVGQAAGIPLEMVYMGKRGPKEIVNKIIETIKEEKLGHYLKDVNSIRIFWDRIESMWHSKMQIGKKVKEDTIMKEIMKMLIFFGSDGGWALLSKGSTEMIKAKGDVFLNCLTKYDEWKENVKQKDFITALKDSLQKLQSPHHCNQLLLQSTADIKENLECLECGRTMKRLLMYECCGDE